MPQFRAGFVPLVVLAAILAAPFAACAAEDANVPAVRGTIAGGGSPQTANVFCPVMPGKKANPEIFYDYKGKRVYFCCLTCKAAFKKNPAEYLPRLPQFAQTLPRTDHDHRHRDARPGLIRFIKPMGITTISLLALTVLASLFRRKNPKTLLKWHKRFGITTLISAIIHATLVLVAHWS